MNLNFRKFEVLMDRTDKVENTEKVIVKPLEAGFGNTLGNTLRRVLLSSMPGVSPIAFKIDEVNNPFMIIPGASTDTVELTTNLSNLKLEMEQEEAELVFKGKKRGNYNFSDLELPKGVSLKNPEGTLINLTGEKEVKIEIIVRKGRGAKEASEHKNVPSEFVPIDSVFSPIKRVGYRVEPLLEEEDVTHEELHLEVETNGTIEAEEAIRISAKILEEHFAKYAEMTVKKTEIEIFEEQEKIRQSINNTTIEELELSVRSTNALREANIRNVGELRELTETELRDLRNMGKKSVSEVLDVLKKLDVQLGDY